MPYFDLNVTLPQKAGSSTVDVAVLDPWNEQIANLTENNSGIKADDFTQAGKLFYLNDTNELTLLEFEENPALRAGQQLNRALEGRLFLKNGESLHQIQAIQEDGRYDIGISLPISNFNDVTPPQRPSFWKYILYPFFADEIAQYNEQKNIHRELTTTEVLLSFQNVCLQPARDEAEGAEETELQLGEDPAENLRIDQDQPALQDDSMGKEQLIEAEEEKKQGEEKPDQEKEEDKKEDLETMVQGGLSAKGKNTESVKAFLDKVTAAAERHTDIANLFQQRNVTQNTVIEYFYRIAEERAAQNLLNSVEGHPEGRDNALIQHMDSYNAMLKGVKNMLPEMIGKETMQQIIQYKWTGDEEKDLDMLDMCNTLAENTLNKYYEFLCKENEGNTNIQKNENFLEQESNTLQSIVLGGL